MCSGGEVGSKILTACSHGKNYRYVHYSVGFMAIETFVIKNRSLKSLNAFEVQVVWLEPKSPWQIDNNTRIISTDLKMFQ